MQMQQFGRPIEDCSMHLFGKLKGSSLVLNLLLMLSRSAASYGGEAEADALFEGSKSDEREPDAVTPYVILLSLAAALGGVLFGYDSVCYSFLILVKQTTHCRLPCKCTCVAHPLMLCFITS
jgi:hypothetical protein